MKDLVVNEALRQIQDILVQEAGAPLESAARARIERVLMSTFGQLAGGSRHDGHVTREVTILLADLRGFTSIAATHPAGTVIDLLNRCFATMSEIIFRNHGAIDKFMGDSILVIFESPAGDLAVRNAISCAVDMQLAMEKVNARHKLEGVPEMYFGIGINTGTVMSAHLGSDLYSEYTVIGDEVNLTSRIESFSLRGQVLISQSTWERCPGFITPGEPMQVFVKGKAGAVVLREVLAIPSLGKRVPRQELRRSPRAQVKIPFSCQRIAHGVVVPEILVGRVLDIGYHGALVEIEKPLVPFDEVKFTFELPLVGERIADLYGRIVKAVPAGDATQAGIEFSSMSAQNKAGIQLFVQLVIQGSENR